jgi:hypothetical protein
MYRPKFCAECGAKIIRLRWRPWTSRRFCERCAPRLVKERLAPPAIVAAAVFLVGVVIGQAARPGKAPVMIQRTQEALDKSSPTPLSATEETGKSVAGLTANATAIAPPTEEGIYICGARTKRGTPCTRRVHGPVRCWQHKGMPAMLPQEKLRVQD